MASAGPDFWMGGILPRTKLDFTLAPKYPLAIYPGALQVFLTFILPLGFISFYPASRLLGKASVPFSGLLAGFAPLAGLCCFALSYGVWRLGLRRYESTGS